MIRGIMLLRFHKNFNDFHTNCICAKAALIYTCYSLSAIGDLFGLLITFANRLNPDQARHDLNPNYLTLWYSVPERTFYPPTKSEGYSFGGFHPVLPSILYVPPEPYLIPYLSDLMHSWYK